MAEQKTSISCRVRSVLEIWLEDGADCDDNSSICDSITLQLSRSFYFFATKAQLNSSSLVAAFVRQLLINSISSEHDVICIHDTWE